MSKLSTQISFLPLIWLYRYVTLVGLKHGLQATFQSRKGSPQAEILNLLLRCTAIARVLEKSLVFFEFFFV